MRPVYRYVPSGVRRCPAQRQPLALPERTEQRWSVDFMSDQFACGRRFRVLNLVDDYSLECVGQIVDTPISGERLACYLNELGQVRTLPETLVCDNGSELTSKAMFFWSQKAVIKLYFIQPDKPTQNAFGESFNARFRYSCLNQHRFRDMEDARQVISAWRDHYNHVRLHSSLDYVPLLSSANKKHDMIHFTPNLYGADPGERSLAIKQFYFYKRIC